MKEEYEKILTEKMAKIIGMLTNKILHDLDGQPCEIFPRKFQGFVNTLDVIDYCLRDIRRIIDEEIARSEGIIE